MEESEETRRIKFACRHATEDALRRLREAGLPRTYIRGDRIIEECPDGREVNLGNVRAALPHLSRAFFFDNAADMRYLAEWSESDGFALHSAENLPKWFLKYVYDPMKKEGER